MSIRIGYAQSPNTYMKPQSARGREMFTDALTEETDGKQETKTTNNIHFMEQAFSKDSSGAVKEAWEKTIEETGFDPFPLGKLSTAYVLYATSEARAEIYGTRPMSLTFNVNSAVDFVEQIIDRLEMPLVPGEVRDPEFIQGEKEFYNKFLENLKQSGQFDGTVGAMNLSYNTKAIEQASGQDSSESAREAWEKMIEETQGSLLAIR